VHYSLKSYPAVFLIQTPMLQVAWEFFLWMLWSSNFGEEKNT